MTKPATTPWVSPYLVTTDGHAALEFYENAFGFKTRKKIEQEGKMMHAEMTYHDMVIMLSTEGICDSLNWKAPVTSRIESPVIFYIYCDDVDKQYQQALAAGAQSVQAPEDTFWGDRMCQLKDPNGYLWSLASSIEESKSDAPACSI